MAQCGKKQNLKGHSPLKSGHQVFCAKAAERTIGRAERNERKLAHAEKQAAATKEAAAPVEKHATLAEEAAAPAGENCSCRTKVLKLLQQKSQLGRQKRQLPQQKKKFCSCRKDCGPLRRQEEHFRRR